MPFGEVLYKFCCALRFGVNHQLCITDRFLSAVVMRERFRRLLHLTLIAFSQKYLLCCVD